MKKLLITEDDKKHILNLYGLLTEAIDPNSGGTTTINNYYPSGWYTLGNKDTQSGKIIQNQLDEILVQVTEFAKKYPNSIVSVKFISQESAIPNKDNEGKAGGGYLEVGGLSDLRKQYLEAHIKKYFDNLKANGVIGQTVEVPPIEYERKPIVTAWVGTPFCPANATKEQQRGECYKKYKAGEKTTYKDYFNKYQKEQSSQLEITVKLKEEPKITTTTIDYGKCAVQLKIRVWVESHNCQNAEFFIFANDLLLYNTQGGMTANLNNAGTSRGIPIFDAEYLNPGYGELKNGDGTFSYGYGIKKLSGDKEGSRSDTFTITKEQSLELLKKSDGKINLWMIATTSAAHKDIPKVTITKSDGTVIYNKAPKIRQGKLLTLDGCTYKVIEGNNASVPSVASYVNKIRDERSALQKTYEIKGGSKKKQQKMDTKALILERCTELVDKMTNLLQYLKLKLQPSESRYGTPEIEAEITKNYELFESLLTDTGTDENPQPQLYKSDGTFHDETIANDKLFGDVRQDLEQFYEGFNAVFVKSKKVFSNGIRNSSGELDGNKILNNIKNLKQYMID
jgi:predicted transcriptional regulator